MCMCVFVVSICQKQFSYLFTLVHHGRKNACYSCTQVLLPVAVHGLHFVFRNLFFVTALT